MAKPLEGQVAYITGAGRGLGRGAAIRMAEFGADVALVARTLDELVVTAELVQEVGGKALVLPVDLQDHHALIDSIQSAERELGPVTALVNNAAVLDLLPFEETTSEIWQRAMAINLHAPYHAIGYLYPKMVERGRGSIHNVSSGAGWKGFANETAYCATKFALEGFSKALALEATDKGVLVTLSTPGIMTKPTSLTMKDMDALPAEETGRWCDPVLMGEAFAYLAYARDPRLAARRFDLYRIAELVRQAGSLDLPIEEVLTHSRT